MSKKIQGATLLVFVTASLLSAGTALGASPRTRHHVTLAGSPQRPAPHAPEAFGGSLYTVTSQSSLAFSPFDSSETYSYNLVDYFKYFTLADSDWGGTVTIPAGAIFDWIGLASCDETGGNVHVFVYQTGADGTFTEVGSFASSAHGATTPCAIDYNTVALGYQNQGNNTTSFQIDVWQTATAPTDGSVRFGAVEAWWYTVVSPAPAVPSFLDVPASNPFFQYIEALKASGITGGCGDGTNFCPDQPVLRKQMAVFLAKALGLAFPY